MSARLPVPGSDAGQWGELLNKFLTVEHNTDGTLKSDGSIAKRYIKPVGGIPESDLASVVQGKLNAVGSGSIADDTVSTAKLQDGAVTNAKVSPSAAIAQSKIANLANDLAAKASTTHTHTIANVTNLQSSLSGKANTSHVHSISDVTNLQASLDGKQAALVSGTNLKTINGVSVLGSGDITVSSGGGGAVDSVNGQTGAVTLVKADIGLSSVDNTSDASKPISTATQTALSGKANTSHGHAVADVSNLQTALDSKVATAGPAATSGAVFWGVWQAGSDPTPPPADDGKIHWGFRVP